MASTVAAFAGVRSARQRRAAAAQLARAAAAQRLQHGGLAQRLLPRAVEQLELAQKAGDGNFYELSAVEARLKELRRAATGPLHLACVRDSEEDLGNLEYLRDCALQAGFDARQLFFSCTAFGVSRAIAWITSATWRR